MVQQLLPSFEYSENDLIDQALALPLEKKIDKAVALLQHYKPKNLRFSGGKDSVVCDWLVKRAGIEHRKTYSNTTIDPSELVAFIKEFHPDAEWVESGRGHMVLDRMVEKMNMPTAHGAWCCDEYKDCCRGHVCELDDKILGVRITESARRSKLWKPFTVTGRGDRVVAPVAYFTDEDIWRVILENDLPYCCLYDMGWKRIGCVGCPKNKKAQKREFELKPEMKAMWQEGAFRCWEKGQTVMNRKGEKYFVAKFSSPDALWHWWTTHEQEVKGECVFEEMLQNV